MTETEIWTKWESQIVNGVFPLRRFLGRSNHSVVFLTECRAQNLPNAAIKIIPADAASAEAQLSRWRAAAALSHPHLIRLLDSGRCKLGGHPFLFVVTEYAEQNLAQILPHRPLTAEEVRELLSPTLDVLAFLHGKNLVHGGLKPPNLLVVNDQLRLSSDSIRAFREPALAKRSPYDAPETRVGGTDAAGDVWSLGVTLIEALTQHTPATDKQLDIALLPASFPAALADRVWRCLRRNPADRPTLGELRTQIGPEPSTPPAPAPASIAASSAENSPGAAASHGPTVPDGAAASDTSVTSHGETSPGTAVSEPPPPAIAATSAAPEIPYAPLAARAPASKAEPFAPAPRWSSTLIPTLPPHLFVRAAAIGVIVLLFLWIGIRGFRSHPAAPPVVVQAVQQDSAAAVPAPASSLPATSAVQHEEMPAASRGSLASIRGQIKVAVLVSVDSAGNVIAENVEVHGASRYFARLSMDAAKKWKFAPSGDRTPREWSLQFDFSRSGVSAQAVARAKH